MISQWVDFPFSMDWFSRENLNRETIDFPMEYGAFRLTFSLQPIHWHMVFLWFSYGFPMVFHESPFFHGKPTKIFCPSRWKTSSTLVAKPLVRTCCSPAAPETSVVEPKGLGISMGYSIGMHWIAFGYNMGDVIFHGIFHKNLESIDAALLVGGWPTPLSSSVGMMTFPIYDYTVIY